MESLQHIKSINSHPIEGKSSKDVAKARQTFFRIYNKQMFMLLEMIDRKASIIITTNAVILSILLGSFMSSKIVNDYPLGLFFLLILASIVSIISALFAIKPFLVKKESDNNLIYNICNGYSFSQYRKDISETLESSSRIYASLGDDLFYNGKNIKVKHFYISISAYSFLIAVGLTISAIIFCLN